MRQLDAIAALQARADEITVSIRCPEDRPRPSDEGWVTLVWRDGRWNSAAPQPSNDNSGTDC